jgi:hypothetical protein
MRPIYISIGTQCTTVQLFRELGLYNEFLPFDWMISTPEFVYTILKLLLADNTDIDYIVEHHFFACDKRVTLKVPENHVIDPSGSVLFNSKYKVCFPHDDITEKEKYKRRLVRLKNLLLDKNNYIYLVYTSLSSYSGVGNYTIDNEDIIKDLYQYIHKIDLILKNIIVDRYKILVFDIAEIKENKIESETTLYIDLQPSSSIATAVKEKMYTLFDTEQIQLIISKKIF